jgi:two-component system chemotaxis sensor kinase CheA
MTKYSKLFVTEARESLRAMTDSMLELEKDPGNKEMIDQLFRACHSIKGMAGMMNMKVITDTTHALEDILSAVREGRIQPTGDAAEAIFRCVDALEVMVSAVESSTPVNETPELIEQLKAILSRLPKPTPVKKKAKEERPAIREAELKKTTSVMIKLGRRCALPSARAVVILKELAKAAEIEQTSPTEEEIEREHMFEDLNVVVVPGDKFTEALRRVVAMTDVDEVLVGGTDQPKEKWNRMARQETTSALSMSEAPLRQNVKVGMDKLDDLLDNVGELVIGRSRLQEKAAAHDDYELQEISTLIDKLTFDIQSRVLGIRMIPLDTVMSRFPRMVRDISKAEGKDVELVVESGSIELDRTVVDKITEPLMHLFRNCIDHGIEPMEERVRIGKRPKGLIRIVASKQQDHVLIEISDDGRGIDLDVVRKTAIAKSIMTKEQADAAPGRELIDLLFRPGFSTKTEVTEVSGRGVGLDVVKKNVEDLGGTVMVNTSKGAGSTFSLWLPFTLAIIEAMLVGIAGQAYAIPMGTIVETHKYETADIKTIRSREVVQLRGEVLPLIRMREFFGIEDGPKRNGIDTLIVQSRDRRAALEVDELSGHQQIVVKSLDKRLRKVRGVSGGTILGSGKIALILDVDSILGG